MFAMKAWSWEALYAFMSRERGSGGVLTIHQRELDLPIEAVGEPVSDGKGSWANASESPMGGLAYEGTLSYRVSFDDGSHLMVEHKDHHYYVTLFPAPLPEVSWIADFAPLPWLALPSVAMFVLFASLV